MKTHGCEVSHPNPTMKRDITTNSVEETSTTYDAELWRLFGDRRKVRKITEHFDKYIEIRYRMSLE